jgi:hypothetical protein
MIDNEVYGDDEPGFLRSGIRACPVFFGAGQLLPLDS